MFTVTVYISSVYYLSLFEKYPLQEKIVMEYRNLGYMALLSFISMYILMYIMVDSYANVYSNFNQFYMAGVMTVPMVIIELLLMGSMYPNKKRNIGVMLSSIIIGIVLIVCVRRQVAVTDQQFLRSMIPHHAAAILMCKQTQLQDPQLQELCHNIGRTQQAEIDFMKSKLMPC